MPRRKLLLLHHFPLTSVTGVTVLLSEMLRLVPVLDPDIAVSYQDFEGLDGPAALVRSLDVAHADATCCVGVNLQMEVQWELSLELARWCAHRSIPLYNYVQDYWPHHREPLRQLTEECGVRLVGSSPFIVDSLAEDAFASSPLPMGAQLPAFCLPGLPAAPKVIASIGRLVRRKRFPDVVRAFCRAGLDQTARLRLTVLSSHVFGAAEDAHHLRLIHDEMEKPGVNAASISVTTIAIVPPDYSALAAYVCASDYEGFSMMPYEAAYAGCPPIVSDIPPHQRMAAALFGERAGDFLYPVGDTEALAERLQDELLTERRRRYLEGKQERIRGLIEKNYSVRTTAKALVELCRSLPFDALSGPGMWASLPPALDEATPERPGRPAGCVVSGGGEV